MPNISKRPPTVLRQWIRKHGITITEFATLLGVTRAAAQFWVRGDTMPRGEKLEKVLALTGLPLRQLIPSKHQQDLRRLRETKRRLENAVESNSDSLLVMRPSRRRRG